jgi:hypothetical protein
MGAFLERAGFYHYAALWSSILQAFFKVHGCRFLAQD